MVRKDEYIFFSSSFSRISLISFELYKIDTYNIFFVNNHHVTNRAQFPSLHQMILKFVLLMLFLRQLISRVQQTDWKGIN